MSAAGVGKRTAPRRLARAASRSAAPVAAGGAEARQAWLGAGLMSGTSCDGIDVALVRITGRDWRRRVTLLGFRTVPYRRHEREFLLRACNAAAAPVADLSRLNFWLGEKFAAAVLATCRATGIPIHRLDFIASHGQTIYHQGRPAPFLGRPLACTWQLGEAACIAERTGVLTLGDFRVGDLAAGGQGAPLVPFLDYLLLRHPRRGRAALNIGGIANLTLIPAGAGPEQVRAFDTGPGNMVMDALAAHFSRGRQRYDRDGRLAARGRVIAPLLARLLRDPFYRRPAPKSAGREQYGREFVARLLAAAPRAGAEDLLATATALTARTIARALNQPLARPGRARAAAGELAGGAPSWEVVVAGGGVHNRSLLHMLAEAAPACRFVSAAAFGIPPDAKEAVAFAVLGHATLLGEAANLPAATGARHSVILGKITPPARRSTVQRARSGGVGGQGREAP